MRMAQYEQIRSPNTDYEGILDEVEATGQHAMAGGSSGDNGANSAMVSRPLIEANSIMPASLVAQVGSAFSNGALIPGVDEGDFSSDPYQQDMLSLLMTSGKEELVQSLKKGLLGKLPNPDPPPELRTSLPCLLSDHSCWEEE